MNPTSKHGIHVLKFNSIKFTFADIFPVNELQGFVQGHSIDLYTSVERHDMEWHTSATLLNFGLVNLTHLFTKTMFQTVLALKVNV